MNAPTAVKYTMTIASEFAIDRFESDTIATSAAEAALEFASRIMDEHRVLYMEQQKQKQAELARKLSTRGKK